MRTSIKVSAYAGAVAVAFAGAFGIGAWAGSPVDRGGDDDGETPAAHDDAGGHGDSAEEAGAGGHEALPAGLQVADSGYTLSPISAPAAAATPGTLSFSIIGPDGAAVTEYTEAHEKDLHLIVVRSDTADYRHVHPTLDADGTWSLDWQWASGGTYKVFADFQPAALDEGLTLARTVDVAGRVSPAPAQAERNVDQVGGYTVTLAGELTAGESSQVTVTVERNGRPVTDLQPYLGAYGHLVALRGGDLAYLHVHPEGEPGDGSTKPGPTVDFAVETPTAGTYRLFFDFQVDGKVRTADFTIVAGDSAGAGPAATAPATTAPGATAPADDGHGH